MEKMAWFAVAPLAVWCAFAAPCRAGAVPAEAPVLKQYSGLKWMYFAPAADEAIVFEKWANGESNVWIAVERSSSTSRALAKTEVWTDLRGRPHTLAVLKMQLEFNDYLREERARGPIPSEVMVVSDSGVLTRQTLLIPAAKLSIRVARMSARAAAELESAASIAAADPNGAAIKRKRSSYWSEKIAEAAARVSDLDVALRKVPLARTGEATSVSRPSVIPMTGLRGLDVPVEAEDYLTFMGQDGLHVRYVAAPDAWQSEVHIDEFVEPADMTSAMAAELQQKEAAAAKAVNSAEVLCRYLFTLPCP